MSVMSSDDSFCSRSSTSSASGGGGGRGEGRGGVGGIEGKRVLPSRTALGNGLVGGGGRRGRRSRDGMEEEEEAVRASSPYSSVASKSDVDDDDDDDEGVVQDVCCSCKKPIKERHLLKVRGFHRPWHVRCLRCSVCKIKLESEASCFYRGNNIYCKTDYIGHRFCSVKCSKCDRALGPSDWVRKARDHLYHLACFACDACKRQLSTGEEFALHDDRLLCKTHYVETTTGTSEIDAEDGGSGQKTKTKRVRTSFSEEQIRVLHANFRVDSNPDGQDLERIAQQTGLSKRVTQVWFQNSRARQKKHQQTPPTTRANNHNHNNNNNINTNNNNHVMRGGPGVVTSLQPATDLMDSSHVMSPISCHVTSPVSHVVTSVMCQTSQARLKLDESLLIGRLDYCTSYSQPRDMTSLMHIDTTSMTSSEDKLCSRNHHHHHHLPPLTIGGMNECYHEDERTTMTTGTTGCLIDRGSPSESCLQGYYETDTDQSQ